MKKVQVLLSTYNGEKYVKEQLDSILHQDYPNITILIRDDGSTDGTAGLLAEYANQYSQLKFYQGENMGAIGSFFDLIKSADISADYYSFSDQDDVWLINKISRAVKALNSIEEDKPLLYCGRTTLVDQDLKQINSTIKSHRIIPSFGNALVENICTGCTSMMNRELLRLIQTHIPEYTVMHDWWFYMTASSFGEVYYDNNSYILYRQHQNNVIGARTNYCAEFKIRLKNYKNNRGKIGQQAREFQRLYQNKEGNQKLLEAVIGARSNIQYRLKILSNKKIFRQRKMDDVIFKVLFLLGFV